MHDQSPALTTLDLVALRKIAEGATPGPWETLGGQGPYGSHAVCSRINDAVVELAFRDAHFTQENAHHIAAFDPPTVLAMIARAEAAEAQIAAVRKAHFAHTNHGPKLCYECDQNYPCPTIAALDGAGE